MEDPVAYDGGTTDARSPASVVAALTQQTAPAPDDHFERQAQASFSQWAALRRALDRANVLIDELRAENAETKARVGELVRANAQISANLADSLARESDAKEQQGWLKGVMASAAGALMEGIGQRNASATSQETRDAVRRLSQIKGNGQ